MKKISKIKNLPKFILEKTDSQFKIEINSKIYDFYIYYFNWYNLSVYLEWQLNKEIINSFWKNKWEIVKNIKNIISSIKEKTK